MSGTPQVFGLGSAVALTDGATIDLDLASTPGNFFSVTLGGNRTLNVTNIVAGQIIWLRVTQDGTGSRTLTPKLNNTSSTFLTSGTPLSTGASSKDLVAITFDSVLGKGLYWSVAKAFA